jgi:branched-chain amino acid transport system ATP-binding protein
VSELLTPSAESSAPEVAGALLTVSNVDLRFGGTVALQDVSFDVARGEIFGMIGPNGAGKTSLLNCMNVVVRPQRGRIVLDGVDLLRQKPHNLARLGIGRTFQGVSLQPQASVLENILFGRDFKMGYGLLAACLYVGRAARQEAAHRLKVEEIMEFLEISHLRHVPAGDLPWGRQKLVEIGRGLACEPRLLLLDEPTSGMTREEKEHIANFIVRMRTELGMTQILIEHDARFVGDLCHRVVALDFGRVIALGEAEAVLRDPQVASAYLGTTE